MEEWNQNIFSESLRMVANEFIECRLNIEGVSQKKGKRTEKKRWDGSVWSKKDEIEKYSLTTMLLCSLFLKGDTAKEKGEFL